MEIAGKKDNGVGFQGNNTLALKPRELIARAYGVSIKYFDGDDPKPVKRIDYDAFFRLKRQPGSWLIEFDKQAIYYNQHPAAHISESLADFVTRSIYPCQTLMDEKGLQIGTITNHAQICKRWENNKRQITERYTGKATDDFIEALNSKIYNKDMVVRSMKYDMFWNLWFHPKYISYSNSLNVETHMYLAILPYKLPIRFVGKQEINPQITAYNSVHITFTSEEQYAHSSLLPEDRKQDQPYYMKLKASFDMDPYCHLPMHTTACFELYQKGPNNSSIPVKKISFTQYQVNTEENVPRSNSQNFEIIYVEEKAPKGEGFMNFINNLFGR